MIRPYGRFRLLTVVALTVMLTLCLAGGADAFWGGLFGKGKKKSEEEPKEGAQTEVTTPAAPFKPVPVPGAVPGAVKDEGGEGALFPGTATAGPEQPALEAGAPLFDKDGAVEAPGGTVSEQGGGEDFERLDDRPGVAVGEDKEPVVFYEPASEEEYEEPLPDLALEDLLFGTSTDEALLHLARLFVAKGEVKKGRKAYSRLIEDFPASAVRFDAFYELGYLRYRENRLSEARMLLKYVVKSRLATITLKDSARALLEEIESIYERGAGKSARVSIGALVPLDGKHAKMGNAALRGILLATGAFESGGLPVDVYVRNTGATAAGAKAAIEELVDDKRVRAIVGPMLSSTATEAARYAQNKRTPVIALSQRDGLTGIGSFVFRNSLLPARQAALVASYAYHTLGDRTFVILYPRSRYGATLARAFAKEVERLGGVVINKESYRPGAKDLNKELRDLFIIEEETSVKGRRVIQEYTPTVVADALYMPDYYKTVSMVVPYLKYFNIEDLQLLGSNGWNSPRLIEAGGRGVRGAVFADGFFSGTERPSTVDFIEKYRSMYGTLPGVVESQAYDSARLLLEAMSKNGYRWMDRNSLRDELNGLRGVAGSIGSISVEEGGEVDKELFLLKVGRNEIVEIEVDEIVRLDAKGPVAAPQGVTGNGGIDLMDGEDDLWD